MYNYNISKKLVIQIYLDSFGKIRPAIWQLKLTSIIFNHLTLDLFKSEWLKFLHHQCVNPDNYLLISFMIFGCTQVDFSEFADKLVEAFLGLLLRFL